MGKTTLREQQAGTLHVVPDANVFIHGGALPNSPWAELGRADIEVLIVAPAIRQIDKLKTQTGRPNKLARQQRHPLAE